MITLLIQFMICMFATLSFAILFGAPKAELVYCAATGAIGWIAYLICMDYNMGTTISSLIATFVLTIIARFLAALRKNPVTVFLVAGIFPIVPGAGIYYTSYYFIMNEMDQCASAGMETVKVAGAIVLGIIFGFAIPQAWFNALQKHKAHH